MNLRGGKEIESKFQKGDIVKIKGYIFSSTMVIENIIIDKATCVWFSKDYVLQSHDFSLDLLEKCEEKKSEVTSNEIIQKAGVIRTRKG